MIYWSEINRRIDRAGEIWYNNSVKRYLINQLVSNLVSKVFHNVLKQHRILIFQGFLLHSQVVRQRSAKPLSPGSNPGVASKKFRKRMLSEFFYPSRRLGISSPREVRCISSALRAVYHHASACILLRLDDIQSVPL